MLIPYCIINAILGAFCDNDFISKFIQHDYQVKDTRAEVKDFNPKYVHHYKVTTFKYNRTTTAFNGSFSFKVDNIQEDLQALVQAYKFGSNEYKPFPIHFQVDYCGSIEGNIGGLKSMLQQCGNFTSCNFVKDTTYYFCNFLVDTSKLPPLIPSGIYKIEIALMHGLELVYAYNAFAEVYRPIRAPIMGRRAKHNKQKDQKTLLE